MWINACGYQHMLAQIDVGLKTMVTASRSRGKRSQDEVARRTM